MTMNEGGFTNGLFAYGTRFQLFTALLFVFGLRGEFCIGEAIRDHTKEPLGTVDAVYDLIDRVLIDPKAKDSICLRIVDPDDEPFPSQRQHAEHAIKTMVSLGATRKTEVPIRSRK